MATIRPFPALRPAPERAAQVSAVPYDVVTTEEARQLASGNPLSFLHVSRPEIDLPPGTDPHSDEVYSRAAGNFELLKRRAPLVSEGYPAVYVYRLRMGDHEQTGVAATCSIDEYDADGILKHERTRKDKEDDRTRHMIELSAQTGPVFLTYRDAPTVDALVADTSREEPLYDFTSEDGVQHTLWKMSADAGYAAVDAFSPVPALYIADGHHRAKSASRAREHYRALYPADGGAGAFNFFLAVLFPASQVRILAYNRVVSDLNGRSVEEFLDALRKKFRVSEGAPAAPRRRGEMSVFVGSGWYGLSPLNPDASSKNADDLDVTVLQDEVLEPILGIRDIRTDKRVDFVGGVRGPAEIERRVRAGQAAAGFSLYPVSLDQVMACSDARGIMPPKSTWFEPKLRDGLLIHQL
ncbi:MAG TPA: DUF1015 family protein [Thermoanaerobaculia bacterium]|nr:DUF1015 family protein [Thermoanaerobaculia bacterium]